MTDEYNKKNMAWVGKTELYFTVSELRKAGVEVLTHKDKIFPEDRKKTLFSWGANVGDNAYFRAFDWKIFEEDEDEEIKFTIDLYGEWPEDDDECKKMILKRLGFLEKVSKTRVPTKFEISATVARIKDDAENLKKLIVEAVMSGEFEVEEYDEDFISVFGLTVILTLMDDLKPQLTIAFPGEERNVLEVEISPEEFSAMNKIIMSRGVKYDN